jgi:hypothetical protein
MEKLEFKGTQGEWVVNVNNPKSMLTNMGGYMPNSIQVVACSKDELLANAKLISAAPELLKALQMVTKAFDNKLIDSTLGNDFNVGGLLYTIDAAINKALK